jgi:hypothetical protein
MLVVLFASVIAPILLSKTYAWICQADEESEDNMIYTNISNVVTGFTASYGAGLALLPKGIDELLDSIPSDSWPRA